MFFFFNDTATTEIYTLSLHDALPISVREREETDALLAALEEDIERLEGFVAPRREARAEVDAEYLPLRSEEHTSELQSRQYLVCRLLLEKKKKQLHIRQTAA